MKAPSIFSKKKRTVHDLHAERAKLVAEKAEAQKEHGELIAGRREIELFAEIDDLQRHDAEIAKQRLLVDRATARLEQIGRDFEALEAEAEQARRITVYDAAKKRRDEGQTALRDYEKYAANAADALARYVVARNAIVEANGHLPEGKSPIIDPEPDNSTRPVFADNGFPVRIGLPHQSVLERAVLPTLKRGEFYFGEQNVPKVYTR